MTALGTVVVRHAEAPDAAARMRRAYDVLLTSTPVDLADDAVTASTGAEASKAHIRSPRVTGATSDAEAGVRPGSPGLLSSSSGSSAPASTPDDPSAWTSGVGGSSLPRGGR